VPCDQFEGLAGDPLAFSVLRPNFRRGVFKNPNGIPDPSPGLARSLRDYLGKRANIFKPARVAELVTEDLKILNLQPSELKYTASRFHKGD
jgi:hypothetical protein